MTSNRQAPGEPRLEQAPPGASLGRRQFGRLGALLAGVAAKEALAPGRGREPISRCAGTEGPPGIHERSEGAEHQPEDGDLKADRPLCRVGDLR